jgi:hypothetical protein
MTLFSPGLEVAEVTSDSEEEAQCGGGERTGGEEETVARREVLAELRRCRWRRGVSASSSGLVSTVIDALLSS